tara:strand:- start:20 stop:589 length:570 start_codon:yes stop_codon:yes gene_type:complete
VRSTFSSRPFENKHFKRLIKKYCSLLSCSLNAPPLIVEPFANDNWLRHTYPNVITNDLNPIYDTDYNLEAHDFAKEIRRERSDPPEVDLILFDPPWTLNQLKTSYEGIGQHLELWQAQNKWGQCRSDLARAVKPGGIVMSWGYESHGFGWRRGFKDLEMLIGVQSYQADRYDILCIVEQKVQKTLRQKA